MNPLFVDMLQYPWEVHFGVYDWAILLIIDCAHHTNIFNKYGLRNLTRIAPSLMSFVHHRGYIMSSLNGQFFLSILKCCMSICTFINLGKYWTTSFWLIQSFNRKKLTFFHLVYIFHFIILSIIILKEKNTWIMAIVPLKTSIIIYVLLCNMFLKISPC